MPKGNDNDQYEELLQTSHGRMTPLQLKFVRAYCDPDVANFDAGTAARIAGYRGSKETYPIIGHNTLKSKRVREAVAKELSARHMTPEETTMHIADIARAMPDPSDFIIEEVQFNQFGQPKTVARLNRDMCKKWKHIIKSISYTTHGPKIELYDRLQALQLIGKHHALFTEKIESETTIDGGIVYLPPKDKTAAPTVEPIADNAPTNGKLNGKH